LLVILLVQPFPGIVLVQVIVKTLEQDLELIVHYLFVIPIVHHHHHLLGIVLTQVPVIIVMTQELA